MPPADGTRDIGEVLVLLSTLIGAATLSVLPGWPVARRLPFEGLTRLGLSLSVGFFFQFLVGFAGFVWRWPAVSTAWIIVAAAVAGAADLIFSALRGGRGERRRFPLAGVLLLVGLACWVLGWQGRIVCYGGCRWYGDWYEHYERAVFFLERLPNDTRFLNGFFALMARAPLFNVLCANWMALLGDRFYHYQVFATWLNSVFVLPLALLLRDIGGLQTRRAVLWAALLAALSPYLLRNETFTWNKLFTTFFILQGTHLYWIGLRDGRRWCVAGAFAPLALGILAHWLTGIYVPFLVAHFAWASVRRRWGWQPLVAAAAAGVVVLAPLFAWAFATYGVEATLRAPDTFSKEGHFVGPYTGPPVPRWKVIGANLVSTLVPYSFRHGWPEVVAAPTHLQVDSRAPKSHWPPRDSLDRRTEFYENVCTSYLASIPGAFGWTGLLAVLILVGRRVWGRRTAPPAGEREASCWGLPFWIVFLVGGSVASVAAIIGIDFTGVAHVNLFPVCLLLGVLLFAGLRRLPLAAGLLLTLLFVCESAVVNYMQLAIQRRPVPVAWDPAGEGSLIISGEMGFDPVYVNNYALKLRYDVEYLSDHLGAAAATLNGIGIGAGLIGLAAAGLWRPVRQARNRANGKL